MSECLPPRRGGCLRHYSGLGGASSAHLIPIGRYAATAGFSIVSLTTISEELGPVALSEMAKHTGLRPEDL